MTNNAYPFGRIETIEITAKLNNGESRVVVIKKPNLIGVSLENNIIETHYDEITKHSENYIHYTLRIDYVSNKFEQ